MLKRLSLTILYLNSGYIFVLVLVLVLVGSELRLIPFRSIRIWIWIVSKRGVAAAIPKSLDSDEQT